MYGFRDLQFVSRYCKGLSTSKISVEDVVFSGRHLSGCSAPEVSLGTWEGRGSSSATGRWAPRPRQVGGIKVKVVKEVHEGRRSVRVLGEEERRLRTCRCSLFSFWTRGQQGKGGR